MASHGNSHDGHSDDGTDFAHPMPLPVLFGVFFALVFLTIVTVAQASFDLGSFDIALVMGIATIKALLVALIFMHLAFDKPFNLIVFISSFVFVGLFVVFTLSDSKMTSPSFEPVIDEPMVIADS
ncbi:MAG: cytochrome C oxidase subunit IV family protein [Planctomycetota bacterium]